MDGKSRAFTAFWKKWEDWLLPGLLCLLLFLWTGLAWDYYFDLNDDVLIRDILSGVYTGEPEALTAQLLWPLAAPSSSLSSRVRKETTAAAARSPAVTVY